MKNKVEDVLKKYADHPEFIGIEIEHADKKGAMDNTALHLASGKGDLEDVTTLVKAGADINGCGDLGNTALHFAAMMGHIDCVKFLLKVGARKNKKNEFDETPFDVALNSSHEEICNLLKI